MIPASPPLPSVRFAAFDLDGTLLDEQGQLRPLLSERLDELAAGGLTPLVVSGRTVRSFRELPVANHPLSGLADEAVLSDGAVVLRRSTGRCRALCWLPASVVRTVRNAGVRDLVAEVGGELIASSRRAALMYAQAYALPRSAVVADSPADAPGKITGITLFDESPGLEGALAGVPHDTHRIGSFRALLIRPRETCKATGLAAHLADRAVTAGLDAVVAFGDAYNDGCMLASCRLGVAVAEADETATRCAHIRLRKPLADFLAGFGPDRADHLSQATVPRPPGTSACSGAHRRPVSHSSFSPARPRTAGRSVLISQDLAPGR